MKMGIDRGCRHGLSRREILQGSLAAAVGAVSGVTNALAQPAAKTGVRAIDIHAHYYPQAYLDLFNDEDKRFNSEYHATNEGFYFKTPSQSSGPLPTKFIDLKQRLADMDAQGVAVHALSLTGPMAYWPDGKLSLELARTWNDAAVAAHQSYPDRFVVLATLPMLDPDRASDELYRVSKLPGVRGIYMGTNIAAAISTTRSSNPFSRVSRRSTCRFSYAAGDMADIPWRPQWVASACSRTLSQIWWPFPWTRQSPLAT
jgi:aminocarboxymuconate-semialdehyde decarboxylase